MLDTLIAKAPIPDSVLRFGIKHLIGQKKKEVDEEFSSGPEKQLRHYANQLKGMPIAIQTQKANEQHYEVPYDFYLKVLGKHLKYSCCSWEKRPIWMKPKLKCSIFILRGPISKMANTCST